MIYILLPAFNEEQNIAPSLAGLKEIAPYLTELTIILIDDGSLDNTVAKARILGKDLNIRIIEHGYNKGLGAAVLTGLNTVCAEANADDVIVLLDADNSHHPNHIKGLVKLLNKGNDIVIASRYAPGGREVGLSLFRRMGSRAISLLLASIFPIKGVLDYTCGYRAYRISILKRGFAVYGNKLITETSFVCMAELLVKLVSIGAKVTEFPLVLRYDLKQGDSKLNIPKTLWRYMHLVFVQAGRIKQISQHESKTKNRDQSSSVEHIWP